MRRRRALIWVGAAFLFVLTAGQVAAAWGMSQQVAAELDVTAAPPSTTDPGQALGLAFETIHYDAPLGATPAWLVPGASTADWVVLMHGRAGAREDWMAQIDAIHDAGYTSLTISYRNDADAPTAPDHRYGMGATEGADLAAAVDYAASHGASKIVLVGVSLGGAAVMSYLREGADPAVAAVVLDSPILDFAGAVDAVSGRLGVWIPPTVLWLGKQFTSLRTGLDWAELDFLEPSDPLTVPALVMHGTADDTVPIGQSRELAARHPDLVLLVETPTGHADAWGYDPKAYNDAVVGFLAEVF